MTDIKTLTIHISDIDDYTLTLTDPIDASMLPTIIQRLRMVQNLCRQDPSFVDASVPVEKTVGLKKRGPKFKYTREKVIESFRMGKQSSYLWKLKRRFNISNEEIKKKAK